MKLRNFVITWVLLLAFTVLTVEYVISEHLVSQGFEDLESEQITTDTLRVRNELEFQLQALDTFVWDWASWDDTFDFIHTRDQEYIDSNLPIETFEDQDLNVVVIRDNDGDIVYGGSVVGDVGITENFTNEVLGIIRGVDLPRITEEGGSGGIINTSQGPMLLAVRPVLLSSGKGSPAGTILMGRLITDDLLEGISDRLGIDFTAHDARIRTLDSDFPGMSEQLRETDIPIIKRRSADIISGFLLLRDVTGMPALVLAVDEPRKITQHGNKVATYTLMLLTAVLFTYSALIVIIMRRRVIHRVEDLNSEVRRIDLSGHSLGRVSVFGNDEISELAGTINSMLARLEEDQAALSQAREGLEKEVQARTLELQEANLELKSLDKAKSRFLSATSHELRTPLTAIHGFIKLMERTFNKYFHPLLLEDAKLTKKVTTHMENYRVVHTETERLGRLIDDMLDLNKIEAGKIEWRDEDHDPIAIVATAADAISGQFRARPGVDLIVEAEEGLPVLRVDKDRIHQVLINLLNNAAKFTDKGYVRLSARGTNDDMVEFTVKDTGKGIPEEDVGRLFEPFYQGQRDKEGSPSLGTGLGLAICKEIVTHYGGTIRIESELGQGSAFIFTIPAK